VARRQWTPTARRALGTSSDGERRPYLRLIADTIVAGIIFPRVQQSSSVLVMARRP
jgi:hypothetical protein